MNKGVRIRILLANVYSYGWICAYINSRNEAMLCGKKGDDSGNTMEDEKEQTFTADQEYVSLPRWYNKSKFVSLNSSLWLLYSNLCETWVIEDVSR